MANPANAGRNGSPAIGEPVLALTDIRKVYGATVAVRDLTLLLRPGEVHALIGENGAGKSTAAQIAAGVIHPTAGQVLVDGHPVRFSSARQAEALGVVFIPQELQLYDALSVAENLYVGRPRPRSKGALIGGREMARRAAAALRRLGVEIDPTRPLHELNHGNRQLVAIARVLMLDARVLIMDEPTASLDEWEAQRLLSVVSVLRESGVAVLYVSHRMPEILQIADQITVMRDGQVVAAGPRADFDEPTLVSAMVGRSLATTVRSVSRPPGEIAFATEGLTRHGMFADVTVSVRAGEVVGLAGLVGSGRSEFAQAAFGRDRVHGGTVSVAGQPVRIRGVRHAVSLGIGYVPEERQAQGLFSTLSAASNVSMSALSLLHTFGVLSRRRESGYVADALGPLQIRAKTSAQVGTLSGGTQQKVLLGRWLALKPKVLILDEPTRGIDVGTRFEIYKIIDQLTDAGVAILLISSDITELLVVSDRVLVMRGGRLVAEFAGPELTELNIGAAALGASAATAGPRP